MKRRKSKLASEFLSELESDPEYVSRRQAHELAGAAREQEIEQAGRELRERLAAIGYPVATLDEIVQRYAPLPREVVTVLLDALRRVESTAAQEQIVRALGASGVSFSGDSLVELFNRTDSDSLRYAVANTMAEAPVTGIGLWVLQAAQDEQIGTARQLLLLAAARHNAAPVANPVLLGLLDQLPGHAAMALAETGGHREIRELERKYEEARGWEREQIGRALSVIRRRIAESH